MSTRATRSYRSSILTVGVFLIGIQGLGAQANAGPQSLSTVASANVGNDRAVGLVAAVVRGDDTLLMNAYGMANLEWDVPMSVDAMFEVGSIAKQFTAVAILQLRDAGKLGVDDDLTTWLPEVSMEVTGVTLRHLLNHTSGIFNFSNTREWGRNTFLPGVRRDAGVVINS